MAAVLGVFKTPASMWLMPYMATTGAAVALWADVLVEMVLFLAAAAVVEWPPPPRQR